MSMIPASRILPLLLLLASTRAVPELPRPRDPEHPLQGLIARVQEVFDRPLVESKNWKLGISPLGALVLHFR